MLLKKELDHAEGVDIFCLVSKKDFIPRKDELDINKLLNVKTILNNFKTKVDDLDVGKIKTVFVDLNKLSDVVDNEVVKNTKINTLKTKVNTLENKFLDATTLIHIKQYNTDKENLGKKIEMLIKKKNRYKWFSEYNYFEFKISEVENKIPSTSSFMTRSFLSSKISESENKILIMTNILLLLNLRH